MTFLQTKTFDLSQEPLLTSSVVKLVFFVGWFPTKNDEETKEFKLCLTRETD